jgi:predicted metallo-beta-lactamase superfamily hydrolase
VVTNDSVLTAIKDLENVRENWYNEYIIPHHFIRTDNKSIPYRDAVPESVKTAIEVLKAYILANNSTEE